jgi:hypothetical protein
MKTILRLFIAFGLLLSLAVPSMALEPLQFFRFQAGDQTFAVKQGDVNNYLLVASTNKAVTVPTGANFALFSASADIWVNVGGVAAVPSGDVTDGTGSELNPSLRRVEAGGTIGVISEYAAKVSIVFYK